MQRFHHLQASHNAELLLLMKGNLWSIIDAVSCGKHWWWAVIQAGNLQYWHKAPIISIVAKCQCFCWGGLCCCVYVVVSAELEHLPPLYLLSWNVLFLWYKYYLRWILKGKHVREKVFPSSLFNKVCPSRKNFFLFPAKNNHSCTFPANFAISSYIYHGRDTKMG